MRCAVPSTKMVDDFASACRSRIILLETSVARGVTAIMGLYSAWPMIACMIVSLAIVATPLFAAADTPPSPQPYRLSTMDGLRGFLALAVFFHHATIYYRFLQDGIWTMPPSPLYAAFGPMGVSLFFMITGYLFWLRLIREDGRPDWLRLYIARLFRIGPLYLAAITVMLAIVFCTTGLHLHTTVPHLAVSLGSWLAFGFGASPDVNGYTDTWRLLAGVTWTLHFEWLFYFSLPFIGLATRIKRMHLPFAVILLMLCLLRAAMLPETSPMPIRPLWIALFATGMTCASLHSRGFVPRLPDRATSLLVLGLFAAAIGLCHEPYSVGRAILLGGAFFLIVSGSTLFGLLVSRPARRLGDISYGIYLLQGLALVAVLDSGLVHVTTLTSPLYYWSLVWLAEMALIAIATIAHVAIERPGIALGRHVAGLLPKGSPAESRPKPLTS
jgi:peptidoglycan/LPS O-acetylase OafA/YrhL